MLQVSSETFDVHPGDDAIVNRLATHKAAGIYTPLRNTFMLLDDGCQRVALLTSHFGGVMALPVSNLVRRHIAADLQIAPSQVLVFSSHNHCSPLLSTVPFNLNGGDADAELPEADLTPEGHDLLDGCRAAGREDPMPIPHGATIGDDVMIGGGCTILPGIVIGARSFIAAGSVVTKDVPERSLVMGVPGHMRNLPPELDRPNNRRLTEQTLDLWHPEGDDPASIQWSRKSLKLYETD